MESILGKMRGFSLCLLVLLSIVYIGAALDAPGDVAVTTNSNASVSVTWTELSDCSECTYKILYKVNGTADTKTVESATRPHQLTSLKAGTTYEVQVVAVNGSDEGTRSNAAYGSTNPATPSNVAAYAKSNSSITVTWDDQDVDSFIVEHRLKDQGTYTASSDIAGSETSYDITGLQAAGFLYEVRVKATKNDLESVFSTVVEQSTKPSAPSGVMATAVADTTDSITVSWDTQAGVTSKVEYSVAGEDFFQVAKDDIADGETSYVITGLTAGTQYDVRVTAKKNGLDSEATTVSAAGSTYPAAPTNVEASAQSTTRIRVTWDFPSDADTFKVEYSVAAQNTFMTAASDINGTLREYVITGLGAGLKHEIIVSAKKDSLESAFSAVKTQATKPVPPENVQATVASPNSISLSWTLSGDATGLAIHYYPVDSIEDSQVVSGITPPVSKFSLHSLIPGQNYSIEIYAIKHGVESSTVVVYQTTKPAAPTGVAVTAVDANNIEVTWTSAPDGAESFRVVYLETGADASSEQTVTDKDSRQATISGLTAQTGYTVKVIAVKHGVDSEDSNTATATTKAEASGITVTSVTTTSISISMTENTGAGVEYKIYYTDTTAQDGEQEKTSTTHTYTIPNLKPGHIYDIAVVISVGGVPGDRSETNTDSTKPKQPSITELIAASTTELSVTWEPAADSTQGSYKVQYKKHPSGSLQTVSGCSGLTCVIDVSSAGGNPGQEYEVSVSAVQLTRESEPDKRNANTKPNSPGALTLDSRAVDQLVIKSTKPPNTVFSSFKVDVAPQGGTVTYKTTDNELEATIPVLSAGTQYNVTFRMVSGSEESTTVSRQFYTKPAKPGAPSRNSATTDSLTVSWEASDPANLDSYKLTLKETSGGAVIGTKTVKKGADLETTFNTLRAGRNYTVTVVAVVGTVESDAAEASMTIKPSKAKDITAKRAATSSLTVQWDAPSNSDYTGFVVSIPAIAGSEVIVVKSDPREATFSELTAGTAYLVSVSTRSGDQASVDVSKSFYTLPEVPTGLAMTAITTITIDVQWTAPASNFDGYIITLMKSGSADVTAKPGKEKTEHQFTGLEAGSTYTISLVATLGTAADQVQSAEDTVTINTKPQSPTDLVVTDTSDTRVTFKWTAPDSKQYTYKYTLTVKNEVSPEVTRDGITSTEITKSSLTPGTTYMLDVMAVLNSVESVPASDTFTLIPDKPDNLDVANIGKTSLEFSWDSPPIGVFDGFIVRWKVKGTGDSSQSPTITATSYEIGGLTSATTYVVEVVAVSNEVESGSRTKEQETLPESAGEIEIKSKTTSSIDITWSPPPGDFDHYLLRIQPVPDGFTPVKIEKASTPEYTFTGLTPGNDYTLYVDVVFGGQTVTVERKVTTKPSVIATLTATTVDTQSIRITWTVDSNSIQDTFKIRYKINGTTGGSSTTDAASDDRQKLINGLSAGSKYVFEVWATSGTTEGEIKSVEQTVVPLPVRGLTATPSRNQATAVTVSWSPGTGSTQDKYKVRYKGEFRNTDWESYAEVNVPTVQFEPSNLIPGDRYTYEVIAVSGDQESSTETTTAVQYPLPPSEVTIDTAATTTSSLSVQWTSLGDESYIEKWRLEYAVTSQTNWEVATTTSNENTLEYEVKQLTSGQSYTMRVYGITVDGVESQTATTAEGTVKPVITAELTEGTGTSTDKVVVEYGAETGGGVFNKYVFTINNVGTSQLEKAHDAAERKVTFDENIEAGHTYTVTAYTVSGTVQSDSKTLTVTTNPNPPTLECGTPTEKSIAIIVTKPASGGVEKYKSTCSSCAQSNTQEKTEDANGVSFTYTNLESFKEYIVEVQAVFAKKDSMSVQRPCTTGEAAPEAVETFEYVKATQLPDEVTLKWTKPLVTNGIILRYELTYEAKGVEDTGSKDVPYPGTEHTFTGLKAGKEYTFTIKAWTKHKDPGDPKTVVVPMPLGKPFCQVNCATVQATVAETDIKSSSVKVRFRNPFSDKYGKVDRFTIIVSTTNKTKAPKDLVTWAAAKNQISGDRFYATIWECDIFDESAKCWDKSARKKRAVGDEITVPVGEESCDKSKDKTYCNGPLDADTNYFFTLRGHTVGTGLGTGQDLYQDTAVSSPVKTKAEESSSSNLIPIVVAVVVVLLILVVVAVVVLLWRRGIICSKSQTRGPDNHGMRPVSRRPKSYVGETSRPIKVADFSKHARKMAQDCDFLFAEEYETLKPVGMNQAMNAAELPENRSKNRFTNIKPYDQHRAKLLPTDDEDGSDYINASWMPGYNSKREFIVTQGPLPATRDDFWRLVWEQNCRAIIMLTKCVEKGRDKCDHYWPVDSEPMFYGDLQVAILNETKTAEWVVTEFKVSKGETSRKLRHFHYTVWPDFGVPERPQTLIRFVRLVRQYLAPDGGPIVVHCSAGVGRSGAFISIDRVLQQLNDRGDIIDIFGIVFEMRTYRRYMVQTEQQYVCIHKCIQCVVDGKEDDENPYQGQVNEAFDVDEGIVS